VNIGAVLPRAGRPLHTVSPLSGRSAMNVHSLSFRPLCEELEERNAPSMTCHPAARPGRRGRGQRRRPGLHDGIMTVMTTPAAGVINYPQMQG
jgi:hypothetical protein